MTCSPYIEGNQGEDLSAGSSDTFRKMNGLGNDFVVLDARAQPITRDANDIRRSATVTKASAAIR